MDQPHLFRHGHTTYAVCTKSERTARAYVRQVMRLPDAEYLGRDTSTAEQQWNSCVIGVPVPADWRPVRTDPQITTSLTSQRHALLMHIEDLKANPNTPAATLDALEAVRMTLTFLQASLRGSKDAAEKLKELEE